jgi:hypothetical protein
MSQSIDPSTVKHAFLRRGVAAPNHPLHLRRESTHAASAGISESIRASALANVTRAVSTPASVSSSATR